MAGNINGLAAYQQTSQAWGASEQKRTKEVNEAKSKEKVPVNDKDTKSGKSDNIKITKWNPIQSGSSLIPTVKEGYGLSIGNVELSDKAKDYYDKLKAKYHNSEFILVSKDMKAQVQANASAYGNANKMVVLIDEEKLERMATDDDYRKKYEGIIAMSQMQMESAKNGLTSKGVSVKNFGMSVNSDGTTSFFATIEKSSDAQAKRIEKQREHKKEEKIKAKKKAEKEAREERIEKAKEDKKDAKKISDDEDDIDIRDDKEYIQITANSMEELIDKVAVYAFDSKTASVMTDEERAVGQNFDFKG
jgi:hypothetical protein